MIAAFEDDRRHREAWSPTMSKRLTACGLEVWDEGPIDGLPCHVCWPDEAHPMEPIWAACRRWDAGVNAIAERTNRGSGRATLGENRSGGRAVGAADPRPTHPVLAEEHTST